MTLIAGDVERLEKELNAIRHQIFFTRKYRAKKELKKKEEAKRKELEKALEESGYTKNTAAQMAGWNPFDPINSATFFDAETMFGFKNGFDVIIGNPPFVDIKSLPKKDVKQYFKLFTTAENRINLYSIFIEKGVNLLNSSGILAFINPNSLLINESYKKVRKYIIDGVEKIIKLPDSAFIEATVETIILLTKKTSNSEIVKGIYFKNDDLIDFRELIFDSFQRNEWKSDPDIRFNIFTNFKTIQIIRSIEAISEPLDNFVNTSLGITPYDKYKGHSEKTIKNKDFHSKLKLNDEYVPLISGKNIQPYYISDDTKEYLKYGNWLGAPREKKFFIEPKIIVRQILSGENLKIIAGYSESPHYFTQIGFSLISKTKKKNELKYITAILNSTLISFYHKSKFLDIEKIVFPKILIANCKKIPIKEYDNKTLFIKIIDFIMFLKKIHLNTSFFERLIDAMVYELYLPEQIKAAGCEVLKYLDNLPELKAEWSDEQKLKTIEKVYKELSAQEHRVRKAMFKMESIEEVRIIEGKAN
jgi:adenine-specific DNA-methyltransferase